MDQLALHYALASLEKVLQFVCVYIIVSTAACLWLLFVIYEDYYVLHMYDET